LLICIVGDHGEALGDHGEATHGFFVYESTMRVPFILVGPGVPRGRVFQSAVRTVDILPTLLTALGLPTPAGLDGEAVEPGGEDGANDRPVYIETELPYRNYGWSPLRGVIDGRLKYIDAPRAELYDILDDPDERHNLAEAMPRELQELDDMLDGLMTAALASGSDADMIDPRLSSLGYVGSGRAAEESSDLADPKDRLDVYQRFTSASRFMESGRPDRALPLLETLVRDEGTVGARLKRAQAWRMLGRLEEAEAELLSLEREDPSLAAVKFEIARIAIWTDRPALTLEKLETYLESSPGDAEALMFRGAAREMLGDMAGAEEDYRRALALNPAFHNASLRLGALLLVTGRTAEARSHLTAHLEKYPDDDIARGLLESL
jgi:tetratricopeptide (TPR) repeat protein